MLFFSIHMGIQDKIRDNDFLRASLEVFLEHHYPLEVLTIGLLKYVLGRWSKPAGDRPTPETFACSNIQR